MKDKNIYYPGGKGSFTIWLGKGHVAEGHMWQPMDTPDEEIGYMVIEIVTKICKENNLLIKETFRQIENNLKMNNINI